MSHNPEFILQVASVAYLNGKLGEGKKAIQVSRPFPELFDHDGRQRFTHIAQGRDKREGFFLKMMGLRRGIYDMFFWPRQGFLWMDFKVDSRLSKDQEAFGWNMREMDIPCHTPGSVKQFSDILVAHGLKRTHDMIIEPDLRSWEKKVDDAIAWGAP